MSQEAGEKLQLTIYLAGPVSNCNEKQKLEWRRAIKSKLVKAGHRCRNSHRE